MIELLRYQLLDKRIPVTEWLTSLRDTRAWAQVEVRLRRISIGNFGDNKTVGDGVSELRIDVGGGYGVLHKLASAGKHFTVHCRQKATPP